MFVFVSHESFVGGAVPSCVTTECSSWNQQRAI